MDPFRNEKRLGVFRATFGIEKDREMQFRPAEIGDEDKLKSTTKNFSNFVLDSAM